MIFFPLRSNRHAFLFSIIEYRFIEKTFEIALDAVHCITKYSGPRESQHSCSFKFQLSSIMSSFACRIDITAVDGST